MDQVYTCAFNIIFENYPKANDAFNNLSKEEIKNLEDIFSYSNLENNLIEFYKAYSIGYPEYLNRKLIFKSMHSITLMSECKDLSKIFDQNNITGTLKIQGRKNIFKPDNDIKENYWFSLNREDILKFTGKKFSRYIIYLD